jgi:hypothetical protein
MNEMTINFNGQDYLAVYNRQSGYYEVDLTAPVQGGIYNTQIQYTDLIGQSYEDTQVVQVLAKDKIKIETNKVFMWIFDNKDFTVKDIIEIADYEITIDEETNANSIVKVLKQTRAKADDIVAIKKNNEVIYWGIIDNIQNEDGAQLHEYTLKYITNMFNQKVALSKNQETDEIEEGYYTIRSALDTTKAIDVFGNSKEDKANVQLYENNNSDAQKWKITKDSDGYYTIEHIGTGKVLDVPARNFANGTNLQQYTANESIAQKWKIEHIRGAYYRIKTAASTYYVDVNGSGTNNGTNIQIYENTGNMNQQFVFEKLDNEIIRFEGIEEQIKKAIVDNFVNNKDAFINKNYLEVRVKTHTKLQTSVTNVTDGLYNLNTWMTNCTQLYNINYDIYIENKKIIIEIENKSLNKELIDVQAQAISNYTEVFETDIVSKVEVLTNTQTYYLYLLNDRTTTTDMKNEKRAEGRTERVYTSNIEDANQKALDIIQANKYNHNVTFSMLNKYMKVGTPIAIKTKKSTILGTYISAIKITQNKFIEYTCGNIRIKFIDKLLKERNKK